MRGRVLRPVWLVSRLAEMQSPQGMLDLRKRYLVEANRQQFAGGRQLGDQEWKRHSCYFGDWKRRCLIW